MGFNSKCEVVSRKVIWSDLLFRKITPAALWGMDNCGTRVEEEHSCKLLPFRLKKVVFWRRGVEVKIKRKT